MNELEKIVYDAICSDDWPPSEDEHWEGFAAKRIVAALEPLIAAAEREACARIAEERWLDKANCTAEEMYEMQKKVIAEAIRARALHDMNKAAEKNGEEL